eukprot:Stramenopile-MAST_4_protein_3336
MAGEGVEMSSSPKDSAGAPQLSMGSLKAISKLAKKAKQNRIEKIKSNASKNIYFRGANWQSDHDSTHCPGCDNKFTCINRRHHCRFCGGLRCQDCSKWKVEGVRSCQACYVDLKDGQSKKSCVNSFTAPIHPESRNRRVWDVLILVLTFHSAVFIPLEMGLPDSAKLSFLTSSWANAIIDSLFVIDVFLNFNTMLVRNNGDLVKDRKIIAAGYLERWFWFDFLAIFPLELLIPSSGSLNVWRRFLKIPRLFRIARIVKFIESSPFLQNHVRTTRIVRLIILILTSCHWSGCLFYFVCELQGNLLANTFCFRGVDGMSAFSERYAHAYFTGLNFMLGNIPEELTFEETIAAIILGFFNAILNAYIIGQVTILIQGTNTLNYMYREKMDIMRDTLVTLGLSETSKQQVLRYYEYLWSRHRQLDTESTFLEGLPISLQTPIKMEMHHDAIKQCYLFQKCDEAVTFALVNTLRVQIFLAGSVILNEGIKGRGMYFLVKGNVALLTEELGTFKGLGDGAYFGELSLLYNTPAACTIKALSDCDTKVLDKRSFQDLISDYPSFKTLLIKEAKRRYNSTKIGSHDIHLETNAAFREPEHLSQGKTLLQKLKVSEDQQSSLPQSPENIQKITNLQSQSFVIQRLQSLEEQQAQTIKLIRAMGRHFHIFADEEVLQALKGGE